MTIVEEVLIALYFDQFRLYLWQIFRFFISITSVEFIYFAIMQTSYKTQQKILTYKMKVVLFII